MKIALGMIVYGEGDEYKELDRALSTVAPFVDKVFITITGKDVKKTEEVCKKYDAVVSYGDFKWTADKKTVKWLKKFFKYDPHMKVGDKLFMFDEARNYNFSQISKEYDWIMWMDADDVLQHGDKLREVAEKADKDGVEAAYFEYWYQVELNGKGKVQDVIIKHLRERLVKNIGVYKWIAPIHETLIEQRPTRKHDYYDCIVVHLAEDDQRLQSLNRNLKNLEFAIYKSEGKDPRHLYYLAKAYFDLNTEEYDKRAIYLMNRYIDGDEKGENRSGWPEERAQCHEYMAEIYTRRGDGANAENTMLMALKDQPEVPSLYLSLATVYAKFGQWERSLFWVRIGTSLPERKTTLVSNPRDMQARTLQLLYNCSLNMGKIDEAWAASEKLMGMFPEEENTVNAHRFITQLRKERDLTQHYMEIAGYLKDTGELQKLQPLLVSAPVAINNNPFIQDLWHKYNPPKPWGEDEIVIYCGQGFTNWSPQKMRDPKESFVGGSEEAVIRVSEELVKKGWKVTVYADPGGDEGEVNGVTWLPYYKFNREDYFNILIGWRDPRFFDTKFKAEKTYLWLHDIPNRLEYTEDRVERISKIMVLSKWQREQIDNVSEDKFVYTSNGI